MVEHGVHAPRLLGGEVAQRALDAVEPGAFCLLVREFRGDAQVEEHGAARLGIVDDVRGIHVLVDDACLVQVAQARHHLLGYEEELAHAERPLLQEPAQRGSRAVLLYQAVPAVQHDLADGLHHVRAVHRPVSQSVPRRILRVGEAYISSRFLYRPLIARTPAGRPAAPRAPSRAWAWPGSTLGRNRTRRPAGAPAAPGSPLPPPPR